MSLVVTELARSHGHGHATWLSVTLSVVAAIVLIYLRRRQTSAAQAQGGVAAAPLTQTGTAPGWYPDNYDPSLVRYWDGQSWTSQTRPRE
jgi:uncharacterized protein DUF2510